MFVEMTQVPERGFSGAVDILKKKKHFVKPEEKAKIHLVKLTADKRVKEDCLQKGILKNKIVTFDVRGTCPERFTA